MENSEKPSVMQKKKAILAVSFGTSDAQSRRAAIGGVENALAQAFPEYEVARAFTSQMILRKLKVQESLEIDTVAQALQRLVEQGVTEVLCQPTHIIPGEEYEKMLEAAKPFQKHFLSLKFGSPLLHSAEDFREVVTAALPSFSEHAALVWMGHGSDHFADCSYAALAYHYREQGYQNVFVATVEGHPALDNILPELTASGLREVVLAPFMLVAGDHAQNDMAGDSAGSWKTRLTKLGFQVECRMTGLGELAAIQKMIIRHAAHALA